MPSCRRSRTLVLLWLKSDRTAAKSGLLYREAVMSLSPGLPRFAATLGQELAGTVANPSAVRQSLAASATQPLWRLSENDYPFFLCATSVSLCWAFS